ncbi:MAG: hypothetical protein ACFFAS_03840 [Promethearchaeota archaeon]
MEVAGSVKLFIVREIGCDKNEFVKFWSARYNDYTTVCDCLYREIKRNVAAKKNLVETINRMGAWKVPNCLSASKKVDGKRREGDFEIEGCNCTYRFTGRWKEGPPVAHYVWTNLHERFNDHENAVKSESIEDIYALVDELADKKYNRWSKGKGEKRMMKVRFGLIYATTYLHFLDDRFPILDLFVVRALDFLDDSKESTRPYLKSNRIGTRKKYFGDFVQMFENFRKGLDASTREVDRALWAFGHYISNAKKVTSAPCCQKQGFSAG